MTNVINSLPYLAPLLDYRLWRITSHHLHRSLFVPYTLTSGSSVDIGTISRAVFVVLGMYFPMRKLVKIHTDVVSMRFECPVLKYSLLSVSNMDANGFCTTFGNPQGNLNNGKRTTAPDILQRSLYTNGEVTKTSQAEAYGQLGHFSFMA